MSEETIQRLVGNVRRANEQGIKPCKWNVVAHTSNWARNRDYTRIDMLIQQGLLRNEGTTHRYQLVAV